MITHWHVGTDKAVFCVDGKPVLTIPARQYAVLIADLAAALRVHLSVNPRKDTTC